MYRCWLAREIKEGLYFTNCPDMFRYEQKIFDFPMCILKTARFLYGTQAKALVKRKRTSFLVYLPPIGDSTKATENFIDIYSEKGRILC